MENVVLGSEHVEPNPVSNEHVDIVLPEVRFVDWMNGWTTW